ncbi:MAG TPA: GatB/YqeY domain-containing protein [Candidatus Saccharibacteria bacterium]|nr:GatB/YqeY domain-containing protein [Candidatus Saccharibacteria bacterium]HMR38089.1 GatB/YqeY domain-containing protein [Candidatus Saccharibacteria bacterium]
MALEARIQDDLKAALLSGNRFVSDTLRGLKAVILDEKVALGKREDGLTDTEIEKLLAKELKKRRESAAIYQENARDDLAEAEAAEAEIIENYLPQQLSEVEITAVVKEQVQAMNATMKEMGQVIGAVKSKLGSSADGAVIAKIVKQELSLS